jgi:hypothetical protein
MRRTSSHRRAAILFGMAATLLPSLGHAEPLKPSVLNRTVNADGSSVVTVGGRLPTEWETKVGVDLGLAAPVRTSYQPGNQLPWLPPETDSASGAAWASLAMPAAPLGWDRTALEARFDPVHEERKLGTTFTRSWSLGNGLKATLQDGYFVTQTAAETHLVETWSTDKSLQLNILPTGTVLSAGTSFTSDNTAYGSISAEQKLFRGISITSAISDLGTGEPNKSLTAGFRRRW